MDHSDWNTQNSVQMGGDQRALISMRSKMHLRRTVYTAPSVPATLRLLRWNFSTSSSSHTKRSPRLIAEDITSFSTTTTLVSISLKDKSRSGLRYIACLSETVSLSNCETPVI